MATNQFVARNGIISLDDLQVTGSILATGPISANLTNQTQPTVVAYNVSTGQFTYVQTSSLSSATSSFAVSASYAVSASRAISAANADTASYVLQAVSASYVLNAVSASRATSAANADTASYVLQAVSASYALTAPFYVLTSSFNTTSASISTRVTNLESTASTLTTASASFALVSASYSSASGSLSTRMTNEEATGSILTSASASFATQLNGIAGKTGSYATTGSNTFVGTQYVSNTTNATNFTSTAAVYTDGGLRVSKDAYISGSVSIGGNLSIFGTASVNFITSSTLIGLEFINLNTDLPALRYAGINVGDSGSAAGISSSFWYDSAKDNWLYIYAPANSAQQTSSLAINGPIAYNNVGNEQGLTANYLTKAQLVTTDNNHHITSSQIYDDGTTVAIAGNLQVTGSLFAGSLTGSLFGTASFASTAATAILAPSYLLTSSFATTSGSISTRVTNLESTASTLTTASASFVANYVQNSQTSSMTVLSASFAQTSSFANVFTINSSVISTATSASTSVGSNVLFNQVTGSYNAAFFKYSAVNGANARVGEVFASFTNGTITFTDFSTLDNGSTTNVTMSAALVGNVLQLRAQTNTSGWTIKSQATYL
jgi:hypothetical protein